MIKPGTKVKFGDESGVVVDWKKYPKFLAARNDKFDFRTESIVKMDGGLTVFETDELKEVVEGKEIYKITEGAVIQRWDKLSGKFLGQKFVPSDLVNYEDELGNDLDVEGLDEPQARAFAMVQNASTCVECPDGTLPDGPVCPTCGEERAPSGIDEKALRTTAKSN